MNNKTNVLQLVFFVLSLTGCGGGGGTDPCTVAGGESCETGSTSVAIILAFDNSNNPVIQCTGVYISLTSVLTAAHCLPWETDSVMVASQGNIRSGVYLDYHPLYDGSASSPFDMAVLKVDTPLVGAPTPLLRSRAPEVGEDVVAFGYGFDEMGHSFAQRVESGDAILKANYYTYEGYDNGTSVITSNGDGAICPGDSGGPVLAKDSNGAYGIIGITRAGPGGCYEAEGRHALLSSMQSNGAFEFIDSVVPDKMVN